MAWWCGDSIRVIVFVSGLVSVSDMVSVLEW